MSDDGKFEEVEIVIAQPGPAAPGGGNAAAAILREIGDLRRRLDSARLLLAAILAVSAVCLALLIVLAARGG